MTDSENGKSPEREPTQVIDAMLEVAQVQIDAMREVAQSFAQSFLDAAKARERAEALRLLQETDLAEMRRASKLSRKELAETLGVSKAAVAKLEKSADMDVSTLRRFIEAMGGNLEIVARFPNRRVVIKNFRDLDEGQPPIGDTE